MGADSAKVIEFPPQKPTKLTRWRSFVGDRLPGLVAGAADLDPAAVLTATVAGASFGLSVAWVVLLCFPVLRSVFHVSAKIGHETRRGLVELTRLHYGRTAGFVLAMAIVVVNFAMILGDLVAVSEAAALILDQSRLFFIAPIAFLVWYLLLLGDVSRTTRYMGLLALLLLCYVAAAHMATPSYPALAKGVLLPHMTFSTAYAMAVISLFGSLLTPDVIVWQTSSRRDAPPAVTKALHEESHAGTIVACLVSFSAVVAASHMQAADPTNLSTRDAAAALAPMGHLGPIIFSLGILGSGLVALPLLVASLCFSVAEAFDWSSGLSKLPWDARYFYVLISSIMFVATLIDFFHVNTVKLLYWSQTMAGFLVVPILGLLILLGRNRNVVHTLNSRDENLWLGLAVLAMIVADIGFLVSLL